MFDAKRINSLLNELGDEKMSDFRKNYIESKDQLEPQFYNEKKNFNSAKGKTRP